jgi:hypothetical protein
MIILNIKEHFVHSLFAFYRTTLTRQYCIVAEQSQDNRDGNENGLAGNGFEKSSFSYCASRQSNPILKTITKVRVRVRGV